MPFLFYIKNLIWYVISMASFGKGPKIKWDFSMLVKTQMWKVVSILSHPPTTPDRFYLITASPSIFSMLVQRQMWKL